MSLRHVVISSLLAVTLVVGACGDDQPDPAAPAPSTEVAAAPHIKRESPKPEAHRDREPKAHRATEHRRRANTGEQRPPHRHRKPAPAPPEDDAQTGPSGQDDQMSADELAFQQDQAEAQEEEPQEPQTADEREYAAHGPQEASGQDQPSADERESQ